MEQALNVFRTKDFVARTASLSGTSAMNSPGPFYGFSS
jgi:hypothetical protein